MSWTRETDDRWGDYRATLFQLPTGRPAAPWLRGPGPFAVVSARNPGTDLSADENELRHEALRRRLESARLEHAEVIGAAPDRSHSELSFAVRCDREQALELGGSQQQEAVFFVEAGRLLLLPCLDESPETNLAAWVERFETSPPSCLLHVPHASMHVPDDVLSELKLGPAELAAELALVTDHFTDELFAPPAEGFGQVRHGVSRLVVDPERFEDDAQEPMAKRGWGVLYERTADGRPLRPRPSAARREELLERHYRPHHAQLAAGVRAALAHHGRALIVDGHSFPDAPLPCDPDQSLPRPDICLGTDEFHSPPALVEALRQECDEIGWSVDVNRPYAGALVPMEFFRRDARVASVMIEVNRRLYLDGDCRRGVGFADLRAGVRRLVRTAARATEEGAC